MSKTNSADLEADRVLEVQLFCKSGKAANLFTLLSTFFTVVAFGILIWILPRGDFSDTENRYLQRIPEPTVSSLLDGSLAGEISEYCKDSFPCRNFFVSLNSYTELALGKREAKGVIVGNNNLLVPKPSASVDSVKNFDGNVNAIISISEILDLPHTVALIPEKHEIVEKELPELWSDERYRYAIPIETLDLSEHLIGKVAVVYGTDHHLTTYGAYLVYLALADELGYTPFEDFTPTLVSGEFYGTSWSKSGLYLTSPDSVELYRYKDDEKIEISGDVAMQGFYDFSQLSKKDKYAVFLGGNYGHINISDNIKKPKLLIIKDSFANAVAPFLARHFELEIVDPRYFRGDISDVAKGCERVLFLYGTESWFSGDDLLKLTLK